MDRVPVTAPVTGVANGSSSSKVVLCPQGHRTRRAWDCFYFSGLDLEALVGYLAAQRRWFSPALGVVAGLVLGPLAVVLFFVPGTVLDMVHQQQCPYCAGWVTSETRVCAHCSAMLISGWG